MLVRWGGGAGQRQIARLEVVHVRVVVRHAHNSPRADAALVAVLASFAGSCAAHLRLRRSRGSICAVFSFRLPRREHGVWVQRIAREALSAEMTCSWGSFDVRPAAPALVSAAKPMVACR